jgi:ribonucleoside-triphosphate reductase
MKRRHGLVYHVGLYVVPIVWNFLFGKYKSLCSIAHINLDAPLTNEETAWELLNYIADAGVNYFAFNLKISSCRHNHGFYGEVCPYCGEPKTTTYQRIVGFLTAEKTYSKERKSELKLRKWEPINIDTLKELV